MVLRFIIMALVLALVFGGLYGFDVFRSQKIAEYFAAYRPPPPPISAAAAVAEDLPKRLPAIGSLAAVHQVTVTTEVGGQVTAISFESNINGSDYTFFSCGIADATSGGAETGGCKFLSAGMFR